MTKLLAIAFINAALLVSLSGCGYKAPPYHEKQTNDKGSTVAL
ncbi:MAG TPA: lipoprotein [Sulfuricurvum sp.]|nr:lipoprotein [Sulfuricurvum sp.]HQT35365.1 lipoprotein [Sulfuricurvum sp.]